MHIFFHFYTQFLRCSCFLLSILFLLESIILQIFNMVHSHIFFPSTGFVYFSLVLNYRPGKVLRAHVIPPTPAPFDLMNSFKAFLENSGSGTSSLWMKDLCPMATWNECGQRASWTHISPLSPKALRHKSKCPDSSEAVAANATLWEMFPICFQPNYFFCFKGQTCFLWLWWRPSALDSSFGWTRKKASGIRTRGEERIWLRWQKSPENLFSLNSNTIISCPF